MTDGRRGRARRSRRRSLVLFVLGLLLAGCTPPGLPPPIAPSAGSAGASSPGTDAVVTIGVDGGVVGFNPHAIADYSLADAAVAQLVLPSVSSVADDGSLQLDKDVVDKAKVTSTSPFTVTYTLDRNAAWSDGTPITAEDFSYLRDQMVVQPGTVDPAGYRSISGIVSRDAGKSVDVTFTHPVPDWMSLFSPLLPSHILKDSPGGWTEGLAAGLPVSGNRYKVKSYDTVTGEITLVRNDKYWGTQPGPSTAVLRLGTPTALVAALGRGDLQAVLMQPGAAVHRMLLSTVPVNRIVTVPLPGTVQLVFNNLNGATADPKVRQAIAAGIDLAQVRSILDGGNAAGGSAAASYISLPMVGSGSVQGPAPGTGDSAKADALVALSGAGYHRESLYMSKDHQILRLTLAYASTDERLAAAARLIQSELAAIGIEVDLQRDDPRGVVNRRLALGSVDLGLVMVPRGTSDALAAASAFGCPIRIPGASGGTRELLPRAGNLSGFCASDAQNLLGQAIAGQVPPKLDEVLSTALPVLLITEPSAVFATSAALATHITGPKPGWTFSSPLSGLPNWPSSSPITSPTTH